MSKRTYFFFFRAKKKLTKKHLHEGGAEAEDTSTSTSSQHSAQPTTIIKSKYDNYDGMRILNETVKDPVCVVRLSVAVRLSVVMCFIVDLYDDATEEERKS